MIPRRSLLAAPALLLHATTQPEEILQAATVFDDENYLALKSYVWNSESVGYRRKKFFRQDKYEVNLLSGSMYWRKLEQMNQTLDEEEARAETLRYRAHLINATQSTVFQSPAWREELAFIPGLLQSHKITRYERTAYEGFPCHYFQLQPNPRDLPYASGFRIEAWIEDQSLHWIHSRWLALRQVSWLFQQLPLGRLSMLYSNNIVNKGTLFKGDHIQWHLLRIPGGPWTLSTYNIKAGPYLTNLRHYDHRKFSADSEFIPE